ncbi:MAG TPA: phytanoyl-CoA dioxygenase family protein [Candidatus Angelobacter sp.]|nr:phytanoyl-CoA dioxygenase family protein [Candidatus Angelobacter sp.]
MTHNINDHGFTVVRSAISTCECEQLLSALGTIRGAGRRGILRLSGVVALARSARLLDLVRPHLSSDPVPVRAIYFDKSSDKNWLVAWHQDLTIALSNRGEAPGFGPWSTKDGIPHVQPPVEYLEQMLTVRLHLDDADETNGALRVLPGSHRLGRLSAEQIQNLRAKQTEFLCAAKAGDALLMRPLLLHASGRSRSTKHRRILHVEYAGFQLPPVLQWHEAA